MPALVVSNDDVPMDQDAPLTRYAERSERRVQFDCETPLYANDASDNDLRDPLVVTKYRLAADIANQAMKQVLGEIRAGARIAQLCALGDAAILAAAEREFRRGDVERGIATPTCVSPNALTCGFSPAQADDEAELRAGDVVKIELGAHIDGYVAIQAFTTVVNPSPEAPITGRAADVVAAAYLASEACARLVRPGGLSSDLTTAIARIAASFGVTPVEEVYSTDVRRFLLEGRRRVPSFSSKAPSDDVVETGLVKRSPMPFGAPWAFEEGHVYQINVMMTTNAETGRPKELANTVAHDAMLAASAGRPGVLQRNVSSAYRCKLRASRRALAEIDRRFGVFPFAVRELQQPAPVLSELLSHDLLRVLPVEASAGPSDIVAQYRFTILCLRSPLRLTPSFEGDLPYLSSQFSVEDPQLQRLLQSQVRVVGM